MSELSESMQACKSRILELRQRHRLAGRELRTLKDQLEAEERKLFDLVDHFSGRPVFLPGMEPTADEYQRGPTVFTSAPEVPEPMPNGKRKRKTQRA
jgi:hypothetical protein